MIDTNRKTITEHKYVHVRHLIESTVEGTIAALQALEVQGWAGMDYDDDGDVTFIRTRLETDEEYDKRIAMEEDFEKRRIRDIDHQRKQRYQQYLKLREEFGEFREYWEEGK